MRPPDSDADLRSEHAAIDDSVRRALEPSPFTVERLVRRALDGEAREPHRGWWPRLAVAAVILAAILIPLFHASRVAPPVVPAADPDANVLVISNTSGYVTITAPDGSKLIVLPGEGT